MGIHQTAELTDVHPAMLLCRGTKMEVNLLCGLCSKQIVGSSNTYTTNHVCWWEPAAKTTILMEKEDQPKGSDLARGCSRISHQSFVYDGPLTSRNQRKSNEGSSQVLCQLLERLTWYLSRVSVEKSGECPSNHNHSLGLDLPQICCVIGPSQGTLESFPGNQQHYMNEIRLLSRASMSSPPPPPPCDSTSWFSSAASLLQDGQESMDIFLDELLGEECEELFSEAQGAPKQLEFRHKRLLPRTVLPGGPVVDSGRIQPACVHNCGAESCHQELLHDELRWIGWIWPCLQGIHWWEAAAGAQGAVCGGEVPGLGWIAGPQRVAGEY